MSKVKAKCKINRVVEVLMQRDNLTQQEAVKRFREVESMLDEALKTGDYDEAEEIIASELGLEIDYIMDFMF